MRPARTTCLWMLVVAGAFCVAVGDYVSGAHKTLVERG